MLRCIYALALATISSISFTSNLSNDDPSVPTGSISCPANRIDCTVSNDGYVAESPIRFVATQKFPRIPYSSITVLKSDISACVLRFKNENVGAFKCAAVLFTTEAASDASSAATASVKAFSIWSPLRSAIACGMPSF